MHTRLLTSSLLVIILSAVVAQAALAGGEPKNQWPFARVVATRTTAAARSTAVSTARLAAEAKNEAPFTRVVESTRVDRSTTGEPKNELPFTREASAADVATGSGSGFSWIDAALGLALGVALTITAVGGTLLARHKVPRTA